MSAVTAAEEDQQSTRFPQGVDEPLRIRAHFEHYQMHMKLDFQYHNEMSFSEDYLELLLQEWCQVVLVSGSPQEQLQHGGFINFEGYKAISRKMQKFFRIASWEIDDEELKLLEQEFEREKCMSLRRFCLYVEQDEHCDDVENAVRLTKTEEYYNDKTRTTKAYHQESSYVKYRLNCAQQLTLDLRLKMQDPLQKGTKDRIEDIIEWYMKAFEKEDPDELGYLDRDGLWKVISCNLISNNQFLLRSSKQVALQLFFQSITLRDQAQQLATDDDHHHAQAAIQWQSYEIDARLRIDSEFGDVCIGDSTVARRSGMKNKKLKISSMDYLWNNSETYHVSLRQYCTFVERPQHDYHTFPTSEFQKRLQQAEWTPALHAVIGRYYQNTFFQKQVMALLLTDHRRYREDNLAFGDGVLSVIISYLPRNFSY